MARSALILSSTAALLATLAASCATAEPGSTPSPATPPQTFTFELDSAIPDAEVLDRIQRSVAEGLAPVGLVRVAGQHAKMVIVPRTVVEVHTVTLDPNFSFHVAEQRERGVLHLEFRDAVSGETLYSGHTTRALRTVARGNGVTEMVFTPTGDERSWPVESMVEEILRGSGWLERTASAESPISREARLDLHRRIDEAFPPTIAVPVWGGENSQKPPK